MATLPPRKGISAPIVTSIPDKWSKEWFRTFISYFLTSVATQTNVTSGPGIAVTPAPSGGQQIGLAPQPGLSVLGVTGPASNPPAAIIATADGQVLQRSSGAVVFAPFVAPVSSASLIVGPPGADGEDGADQIIGVGLLNPSGNPTALVGLSAINGTSSAWMRSDAAPALNVTISPTWTGNHTFTPGSGTTTFNGASGNYTQLIQGSGSAGSNLGLLIQAGAGAADAAIAVLNSAASVTFFEIFGDGHGTLGPTSATGLNWTAGGNISIAPPTSGTAFTVTSAFDPMFVVNSTHASGGYMSFQRSGVSTSFFGNSADVFGVNLDNTGIDATGAFGLDLGTNDIIRFQITSTGACIVVKPTSGDALTVTNVAGANALVLVGNSAGTAVARFNTQATTGAQTATFAATNKPGSGTTSPDKWLPVSLDGVTHYIPCFL